MPIKLDSREYRNMADFRIANITEPDAEKIDDRKLVEGYATTFDEPYELWKTDDIVFNEVIDASAFNETDMSDVIMQYNHEGRVFARISNGTLEVKPDEHGLFITADLGGTEIGRGLYEEIKGGYTDKMSFGFVVGEDDYTDLVDEDGTYRVLRRITSISKLYDVSAVSIPANDATTISVRALSDGVVERVKLERLKAIEMEVARKRIALRAIALNAGRWK